MCKSGMSTAGTSPLGACPDNHRADEYTMTTIKILAAVFTLCLVLIAAFVARKTHLPGRIKKAEEFLENEDIQKASEIVKKLLYKYPDYAPARYLRARILIKQKQYLLAISELNGVLGIAGFADFVSEVDVHYHLADLYHDTQQWQKEVEEYKAILKFNPDDIRANHRIGHVLYRQKNYGDAREHLLKAYTQDPSLGDCLLPLGVSCFHSADHTNAEQYLLKSLEAASDPSEAQYYLGALYKSKKDYETAMRMYNAVRKDRRFLVGSMRALGEIYAEQEMYDEAIERLEEGLGGLSGKDEDRFRTVTFWPSVTSGPTRSPRRCTTGRRYPKPTRRIATQKRNSTTTAAYWTTTTRGFFSPPLSRNCSRSSPKSSPGSTTI
ncbi:MAG: tetratricopeptide repeat protein [Spirochaetales bacterium]|nr:MAG: tetratricopeptide repeat protein [Spirochaetales bacterium]